MANRTCSIDGCNRSHRARGYCSQHYKTRRDDPCIVEGCDKPKHVTAGYCATHHYRVKRYGDPNPNLMRRKRRGLICTINGCDGERYSGKYGWCAKHYDRWWRHGDPLKVLLEMGSGDNITNSAAHKRVVAINGKAQNHDCIDCGQQAAHWSYDHADSNERQSDHGPYSLKLEHYQARCVPCHKRFDLTHLDSQSSSP